MEYIWCMLAAIGAGVGTRLAGLSAATVMVPILIVLCPSFQGESGAYQATAIALTSNILGSAVSTGVYIKHKHIDLKHGWIMLCCIVLLCVMGSYMAYKMENTVLSAFMLILTFCIGIRFLIKPDTTKKQAESNAIYWNWKRVAVLLFFGLTIGFGTGFVGSGGGMMMLVVFTAFLGYERKSAVGTSTFIMTLTALIGFMSHVWMHPAIILQKWDILLICIFMTTISSLFAAQFANRVSNRMVGLATSSILTALSIILLPLYFYTVR